MPTIKISSPEELESLRQGFILDGMLSDALDRIEEQNEELTEVRRINRRLHSDNRWAWIVALVSWAATLLFIGAWVWMVVNR